MVFTIHCSLFSQMENSHYFSTVIKFVRDLNLSVLRATSFADSRFLGCLLMNMSGLTVDAILFFERILLSNYLYPDTNTTQALRCMKW
jgi:hypothetical protein